VQVGVVVLECSSCGFQVGVFKFVRSFIHAPINDTVYVQMPRGFSETGEGLKLRKSLYGPKQSPRNFFVHLKSISRVLEPKSRH
jgi:hypothetical protein